MINWPALRAAPWQDAPFRHKVIRGFFEEEAAYQIALAFPRSEFIMTHRKHLHSDKWTLDRTVAGVGFTEVLSAAFDALNSPDTLRVLSDETGIVGLEADPALYGGGAHVSKSHGFLDVHADFMRHPTTGHQRILNLLIYMTPDWNKAWGGGLELWPADMSRPGAHYACEFNTAVLFECSATSYHGVSEVRCPPSVTRNSLALYLYRPWPADYQGVILETTDYRPRPWQYGKRLRRTMTRLVGSTGRQWLRRVAGR